MQLFEAGFNGFSWPDNWDEASWWVDGVHIKSEELGGQNDSSSFRHQFNTPGLHRVAVKAKYEVYAGWIPVPSVRWTDYIYWDVTVKSPTLRVTIHTPTHGTVSPRPGTYDYQKGSVAPIVATPTSGYRFVRWNYSGVSVAKATSANTTMTINASGTLCPQFERKMVTVPNVVGRAQAQAQSTLTSAGLSVGTITKESSSTAPQGQVIRQSPVAGTQVASGTAVNLTVSSGPDPQSDGSSGGLLRDPDFNASSGSTDLRADATDQDWYESRQDMPTLLTLDYSNIGGNATKKARLSPSPFGNAYLTQEFSSPQTQPFVVEWDIYVDSILDRPNSAGDRAVWMFIGDDTGTNPDRIGPNAEDSERFVYLAFCKPGGGSSGTMDLVARENWDATGMFWTVATGLSLKRWYTIGVICDLAQDMYEVYIDGQYQGMVAGRTSKSRLTHISFAQWTQEEGAATFYVDNVKAESLWP
jgi:hypothetical protein